MTTRYDRTEFQHRRRAMSKTFRRMPGLPSDHGEPPAWLLLARGRCRCLAKPLDPDRERRIAEYAALYQSGRSPFEEDSPCD